MEEEINFGDDITVAGTVIGISDNLIEIELKSGWHITIRKDDIKTLRPHGNGGK